MSIFKGAGVAIITPFKENGDVNFDEFGKLIEMQIEGGTDAIIVCGTTGEASTMNDDEHLATIKYCIDKVAGRIPVVAGTGSNSTKEAVNLSKKAAELGADGLLCVTPYYNKATQEGLYQYYKAISDAVDIPIIMYNVPGRTSTNIQPETAVRIAKEVENVVAIKEASGNIAQVAKLASLADGCLDIYSGNDDQVIPILSLGGIGVISVLSNVAPKDTHDMVMSYLEGNTKKALSLQLKYLNVIHALFSEVNPIPVKWAANIMGYKAGGLRLPLTELEESHKKELELAMKNACIIQ